MKPFIRLCALGVVIELVVCAIVVARHLNSPVPLLPEVNYHDPLLQAELGQLAKNAEQGTSRDWHQLAEALLGHGYYAHAEQNFRTSLELDPDSYQSRFLLAFCLERTGRTAESTLEYRHALELAPRQVPEFMSPQHALYAIGKNYLREENIAAAENVFREAGEFPPAEYQLAKLMVRAGRVEEALPVIDRNLALIPDSLKYLDLRYRAMIALDRPLDALKSSEELEHSLYQVQLNFDGLLVMPMNQRHGFNRQAEKFQQALGTGDPDYILAQLKEILALIDDSRIPGYVTLVTRMAEIELQRDKPEAVLELVERLKRFGEANADMLQLEGAALERQGESERAVELWSRANLISPNGLIHQRQAEYYDRNGNTAMRDEHLGHSALLQAKRLYWNNDYRSAQTMAEQAVELTPSDPQAWFYLGQCQRLLGQQARAIDAYRSCLELNPNHVRAMTMLNLLETDW